MSKAYGYKFYFADTSTKELFTFPITPGELEISVGSNNKVVTLIDEGDINILKSPALIEISFEARFPMRQYPYARSFKEFESYFDKIKALKEQKTPFRFIVARETLDEKKTWDTNLLVALEEFTIKEDAEEGDDVLVDFELKQYKEYAPRTIDTSAMRIKRPRARKRVTQETYTVKNGDCLWNIAKKKTGDPLKWKDIYDLNKKEIEDAAKSMGYSSSSKGHWIFQGSKLVIEDVLKNTSLANDGKLVTQSETGTAVTIVDPITGQTTTKYYQKGREANPDYKP